MKCIGFVAAIALLAISIGTAGAQTAQDFPNRPLRYIVPFPPGGSTDIVARVVAAALTEQLKQQVVIDNRAGAGGTVGAGIAARTSPDGYNIFACNIASLAVSPALYRRLDYDPVNDFTPVGLVGSTPNSLVVHPSVPAKSVAEFIELAKSRPGKLNYGSAGVGTSPQLSMEMFKLNAGLDIVHIAYRGAGPAVADLVAGHVNAMFATVPSIIGAARAGRVRVLAVTSSKRFPDLPDVPTIAESGMPGFEVISWQGVCTPSGTPDTPIQRLRAALMSALAQPQTVRQLGDQGVQAESLDAIKFAAFIQSERTKWGRLVSAVGISPR